MKPRSKRSSQSQKSLIPPQTLNKVAKAATELYKNIPRQVVVKKNYETIQSGTKTTEAASINRYNYITTNRFYVELGSTISASFSEFSGIGVNIKKESYLEGGVNNQQRIILGHAEFNDVTLKRGMTDSLAFWDWVSAAFSGKPGSRRNLNILLFNQAGETMQSWTLIGAIPISWKAPGFQADGNSVAIEELTMAYEGLKVLSSAQSSSGAVTKVSRGSDGFFTGS